MVTVFSLGLIGCTQSLFFFLSVKVLYRIFKEETGIVTSIICKQSADSTESQFVSISKRFPLVVKRILPPVMDSPGKV